MLGQKGCPNPRQALPLWKRAATFFSTQRNRGKRWRAIEAWAEACEGHVQILLAAIDRIDAALGRLQRRDRDVSLEAELLRAGVTRVGPALPPLQPGQSLPVVLIDDDAIAGFGYELVTALTEAGVELSPRVIGCESSDTELSQAESHVKGGRALVVVWLPSPEPGRVGRGSSRAWRRFLKALPAAGLTVVGLCGPHPLHGTTPLGVELLLTYDDGPRAQAVAASVLLGEPAPGRLPVSL